MLTQGIGSALDRYEGANGLLPGIAATEARATLIEQLVESQRRRRYVQMLTSLDLDPRRADPSSDLFDPLKAAAVCERDGLVDEAFWMAFLSVHFGRSRRGGWRYARDVYGKLGDGRWDWPSVSQRPADFRDWLEGAAERIRGNGPGGFGNHRKYQKLSSTGETVETYVAWVGSGRSHAARFGVLASAVGNDPNDTFAAAYRSMAPIVGFGRTARFDYLTAVGRLGLFSIEPDRAYLDGATGPLSGAQQLFGAVGPPHEADQRLVDLGTALGLTMDVVEDGVCNWQKSPSSFRPFRG